MTPLEKLICVSYDRSGEMYTNLTWTKLSADKTTVTCSFSFNTALYLDTTCQFVDKSLCPKLPDTTTIPNTTPTAK